MPAVCRQNRVSGAAILMATPSTSRVIASTMISTTVVVNEGTPTMKCSTRIRATLRHVNIRHFTPHEFHYYAAAARWGLLPVAAASRRQRWMPLR